MSNKIENYLISFGEELGKEGYSIIKAGVNTFYKAKGEMTAYTIDNYMNTRFEIRVEDFAYEQEKLSRKQREKFYENINARQLNFLFELLEKARTSTYDLHAKILAQLYGNLILNGNLNYHESTFLANINILNDEDLFVFYNVLEVFINERGYDFDNIIEKNKKLEFETKDYTDLYIYDKLIRVGLISNSCVGKESNLSFWTPKYKEFYIHAFSKDIYLLLKEIF